MGAFSSTEEMYEVFTPFYTSLTVDPEIGPKFVAANTSFRVIHTDPAGVFLLDATSDPAVVTVGEEATNAAAEVELTMSADDGHKFWQGDLNIPLALARRKVKVNGSINKLLGMLPAMQPAYSKYKAYLSESGRPAG